MIAIVPVGNEFGVSLPFDEILVQKIRSMPQRRWDKEKRLWRFKPTLANFEYLEKWFPDAEWSQEAETAYDASLGRSQKREENIKLKESDLPLDDILAGVPFKLQPFEHQKKALVLGRDLDSFAYLMDMGTGKTKVLIDDACHNYRNDKIDALVVACPNSVKTNWVSLDGGPDEIEKHMPDDVPYIKAAWVSSPSKKQRVEFEKFWHHNGKEALKILAINVETLHVKRVIQALTHFCTVNRVMIAVDESTRIKNRAAKRTRAITKIRELCPIARILSGQPIIKSPLDAFAQFKFLDPDIMGFDSYYAFQNYYAIMGGFGNYQVLAYKHTEELSEKISSCSFRIMKDECLDLPQKIYNKRSIEMSLDQAKAYRSMEEEMISYYGEEKECPTCYGEGEFIRGEYTQVCPRCHGAGYGKGFVEAKIVLTQLLRLQQITSGYLPLLDKDGEQIGNKVSPIGKINPKILETVDIIQECNHKVIVWARFIPDILGLKEQCDKAGIKAVTFYGDTGEQERMEARREFQDPESDLKVFIGQVRTGGIGLDLYAAGTVIYLSNSFSTEDRVQSEDRAHRIGQTKSVEYIDLIVPHTVDEKIVSVLRDNKKISDEIMKDGLVEWI